MFRLATLFFAFAFSAHAAPMPPALHQLETSLATAQANLTTLNTTIRTQQRAQRITLNRLTASTTAMLRLASWPSGLLQTQSIVAGGIPIPALLANTRTALARQHATLAGQVSEYLTLRTQATTKLQELSALQTTLAGQRQRLNAQQQQALRLAALDATALASRLQAPNLPPPVGYTPPATATPRLHPVAGAFKPTGDGGTLYVPLPNAPVVAVMEGKIAFAGPFQNLGGLVITESAGGVFTVYAGLGTLVVNEGQAVPLGAPLGTMPATHPTLYVEVRRGGRPLALQAMQK